MQKVKLNNRALSIRMGVEDVKEKVSNRVKNSKA